MWRLLAFALVVGFVKACGPENDMKVIELHPGMTEYLMTPDFPNNYPDYTVCYWLIRTYHGRALGYVFSSQSELEPDSSGLCRYDNVTLYENSAANQDNMIGRYCGEYGSGIPSEPAMTLGNTLLIVFRTDKSKSMNGFKIVVKEGSLPARDGTTTPKISTENRPAMIAAIIGGVIGSLILICCVCCCCCTLLKGIDPEAQQRYLDAENRVLGAWARSSGNDSSSIFTRRENPGAEGNNIAMTEQVFKPPPYGAPPSYFSVFPGEARDVSSAGGNAGEVPLEVLQEAASGGHSGSNAVVTSDIPGVHA